MITGFSLSGHRGVGRIEASFSRGGLIVIAGGGASGKSALFGAVRAVQQIARGATAVPQVFRAPPYAAGACGPGWEIELGFRARGGEFRYRLSMDARPGPPLVASERLLHSGPPAAPGWLPDFERERGRARLSRGPRPPVSCEIPANTFALSSVLFPGRGCPVADARDFLSGMLLLKPVPSALRDEASPPEWLRDSCCNLPACMAAFLSRHPAVYPEIEGFCRRTIEGFEFLSFREAPSAGRYLFLRKGGADLPVSLLSDSEKRLLAAAFAGAVGRLAPGGQCVWDDFLMGIPAPSRDFALSWLRDSFSGGQLIGLTSMRIDGLLDGELFDLETMKGPRGHG